MELSPNGLLVRQLAKDIDHIRAKMFGDDPPSLNQLSYGRAGKADQL